MHISMDDLPSRAGPVPDRLSIWPLDDGRYGLDATFQGKSGFERAELHTAELTEAGVSPSFRTSEIAGRFALGR